MLLNHENTFLLIKKLLWTLVSVILILNPSLASSDKVDEILTKIDELYRADTSLSKMEMIIETDRWKRTMKMDIWTKGMDYTFVLVQYPKKDKGVATLKRKQEMWNFFPKINKVIKVPPSMMMSSWMGSDFSNDDLVKESSLREDYHAKLINPDDPKNYSIELKPKEGVVTVWGKIISVVDKKSLLPVSQDFYDERGKKVRTIEFKDVKKLGGKLIPSTMILKPLDIDKKGNRTIVKYIDIQFNIDIPEKTFTRHNLQKRR